MSELESPQVQQILLKPDVGVVLSDSGELTAGYIVTLSEYLEPHELGIVLEYVRPMSGGVHVLSAIPAITVAQSKQLTELLSDRDDVEYAEPDLPRRR